MKRPRKSKRQLAPRQLPLECLCCGESDPWVAVAKEVSTELRGETHTVAAKVMECRHCNTVTTTPRQDEALLDLTKEAHIRWLAKAARAAQTKLALSQREFALETGVPIATYARVLKGETLVDQSTEELLWMKVEKLQTARTKQALLSMPTKPWQDIASPNESALTVKWGQFDMQYA